MERGRWSVGRFGCLDYYEQWKEVDCLFEAPERLCTEAEKVVKSANKASENFEYD